MDAARPSPVDYRLLLASHEALVGQLFIAVTIARLVGLYTASATVRSRDDG